MSAGLIVDMNTTESSRITLRPIDGLRADIGAPATPSPWAPPASPRPHGDLDRSAFIEGTVLSTNVDLSFLAKLPRLTEYTVPANVQAPVSIRESLELPVETIDLTDPFLSPPPVQFGHVRASVGVRTLSTLVRTGVATPPVAPHIILDTSDVLLSAVEAAGIAGVTDRTIRRWINSGRLPHTLLDGQFMVTRADLDAAAEQPSAPRTRSVAELNVEVDALRATIARLEAQVKA